MREKNKMTATQQRGLPMFEFHIGGGVLGAMMLGCNFGKANSYISQTITIRVCIMTMVIYC